MADKNCRMREKKNSAAIGTRGCKVFQFENF